MESRKLDKKTVIQSLHVGEALEVLVDKILSINDPGALISGLEKVIADSGASLLLKVIALSVSALPDGFRQEVFRVISGGMMDDLANVGGYPSYREYLKSAHWQETRERALERAGGRCCVCGSAEDLDVHHRTYERLGAERDDDVVVLCKGCHAIYHAAGKIQSPAAGDEGSPRAGCSA